jgi:hypothetical protein
MPIPPLLAGRNPEIRGVEQTGQRLKEKRDFKLMSVSFALRHAPCAVRRFHFRRSDEG